MLLENCRRFLNTYELPDKFKMEEQQAFEIYKET